MNREEFLEDGIVIESVDGNADIALITSDNCEECGAKLFCKPKADSTKILKALDPFGAKPGDEVRISIKGSSVLKATFLLYGMPLLLLIIGIFAGMEIFTPPAPVELYSFILGLGLLGFYFGGVYLLTKRSVNKALMPIITFVKKR